MKNIIAGIYLLSLIGCSHSPAVAPSPLVLKNAQFVSVDPSKPTLPAEWTVDGEAVEIGFDPTHQFSRTPSVRVVYKEGAPYAGLIQRVAASAVRGKTLHLRTHIDRLGEGAEVGVWVKAFNKERKDIAYQNTYETKQRAHKNWTPHEMRITIPLEAEVVMVGAAIYGKDGTMWVDGIDLRVTEK
jgi:hypothetical protein